MVNFHGWVYDTKLHNFSKSKCLVLIISHLYYCFSPAGGGRHFYTHDEDVALILFVKENQAIYPIKGNSLYKEAAKAEVPCTESVFIALGGVGGGTQ